MVDRLSIKQTLKGIRLNSGYYEHLKLVTRPLWPVGAIQKTFWIEQGKKSVTGIPFLQINQLFGRFFA